MSGSWLTCGLSKWQDDGGGDDGVAYDGDDGGDGADGGDGGDDADNRHPEMSNETK